MENILYVFYIYIFDLAKVYLILFGAFHFNPVKKKKTYLIAGAVILLLLIWGGVLYKEHTGAIVVALTVMVIISSCFFFQDNLIRKFSYSLLAYIVSLFMDSCWAGIASLLCNIDLIEASLSSFANVLINSISIILLGMYTIIRFYFNKRPTQINLSRRIYALVFAGTGSGIFILAGLTVQFVNNSSEKARRTMIIITIIIIVIYCAACFMMLFILESRDSYKALSLINQSIIESQQKYYELVREKQQEMRSIRHDMKNHMFCILALYHAGKLEEMERYIAELVEEAEQLGELFSSGNDIVDAILNDAYGRYQKEHIEIVLEGCLPAELYIAPFDLCVIFANLITNAVEAVIRMEREENEVSIITVKISSIKDDLYIFITNPVGMNVDVNNGDMPTVKEDKTLHGFGVKNVRQRVAKYHGSIKFLCENKSFSVDIHMKNNSK